MSTLSEWRVLEVNGVEVEMSQVRVTYPALDRAKLVMRLRKASAAIRGVLPVTRVILFGSYALNRYTAGSDIDLVVVYEDPQRSDAYKTVVDTMRLPSLEPRLYTESQYRALMTASPKFAMTLITEGIAILGEA